MLKNYFKTAWRNMIRNKVSSFINITGLAIGIASVILILLYVQDELSYDRFIHQSDHIFQVNLNGNLDGNEFLTGNTPPPAGPSMVNEFPEIEASVRIYRPGDIMVRYEEGGKTASYFTEKNILGVDSNFLQVFTYQLMQGDPSKCLENPNSIVITEKAAKKYFGNRNPIGKILLFDIERTPFKVTGVLRDIPSQSSLQFDMLAPISSYPVVKRFSWSWVWLQVNTYVKLRSNVSIDKANIKKLEAKFPAMVKKYGASGFKRVGKPLDELIRKGGKWDLQLQPLTSIHLYAGSMGTNARLTTLGNIKYVYIFSVIAIFIIILACVNFMNLSTAQSAKRAKEVGIRKVLGSEKRQLIKQFLGEAMLFSVLAAVVAIILVLLLLKPFNEIAGKSLDFNLLFSGNVWMFIAGLIIITGLLAGSYPAFYLTSFKPVTVLRGIRLFKSGLGNLFVRNGLVVFQFAISTALIVCTIIVYNQLNYTRNRNLGFNKESVVIISNSERLENSEESFRQEITRLPGIINATISSGIPASYNFGDGYEPEPADSTEHPDSDIGLASFMVDYDFIPTLQIEMVKGRNFSKDFSDSASVILNETAVEQIGWKDPIGRTLGYPGNSQSFKVIGVTKDFNIGSLQQMISPFALFHTSSQTYSMGHSYIIARMKPGNTVNNLNQLESKWKSFSPDAPFDYSFLDGELNALYRSEQRMGAVFIIFTVLSIFVACLGLFGLAAYTAERRTKEIGVRKILGGSVQSLVIMLSKDFVRLVLFSATIAFPVAWWFMHKWLQDFAYRISINWWVFAAAGVAVLLIALLTVSFQAIKAAIANPVKSLRTE